MIQYKDENGTVVGERSGRGAVRLLVPRDVGIDAWARDVRRSVIAAGLLERCTSTGRWLWRARGVAVDGVSWLDVVSFEADRTWLSGVLYDTKIEGVGYVRWV